MDPRVDYYSERKQRQNPTFISHHLNRSLLCYSGGPLKAEVKPEISRKRVEPSPLSQYASLLLSQRDADYARSMLTKNARQSQINKIPNLDVSDGQRYYLKRRGIIKEEQLITRNSMKDFINGASNASEKIHGRYAMRIPTHKQPYGNASLQFQPKMLTNADEVKAVVFGG